MKTLKLMVIKIVFLLCFTLTVLVSNDYATPNQIIDSKKSASRELEILLNNNPVQAREIFKSKILSNVHYRMSEAELDSLGYHLIKQNKIKEANTVFQINVEISPNSWKAWDSLGEGYLYLNDETIPLRRIKNLLK